MPRPLLISWFLVLTIAASLAACGGGGGGGGDRNGPAPLPTPPAPVAGQIGDTRLAEILQWARSSQSLPAVGLVVVRNGQVVERAVVGLRSASAGVTVTTEDRWHLGSLTKSMTSTLAALLVEDGLLSWDTAPLEVWPELDASIHPGFRGTTLRQLLSHTSGMERDDDFSGGADSAPGSLMDKRRAWAAHLLRRAPQYAAGTTNYSNVGYVVAGAMLEARAQTGYESLLSVRLFAPLGMTNSGFGAPGSEAALDQPWGHVSRANEFDPVPPGPGADNRAAVGPAGTVHASLDDFARYLIMHIDGARGVPGLLTAESFAILHTPVASNYALGWGRNPQLLPFGVPGFTHAGSNLRWYAQTIFIPSENVGMLIVTNGGGARAEAAVAALDTLMRQRIAATL